MKNTFTDLLFPKRPPFTRIHIWALIMRISQVYFLMMTSVMIAAASPPGNGQSIETTVVSLEITNEPLRKVFQKIESQTDFLFAWNKKVNDYGRVTLVKGNYTVKNVLDIVLKGTGLKYEQDEKYILVTPEGKKESVMKEEEVENRVGDVVVYSAALVTGTVRDAATQEPLAGVNIIVKGTSRGTTTDVEGKFGIGAEDDDVLVFSFIGFIPFEAQVSGRTVIDIFMETDIKALQEVVINAGYWEVTNKEKTGNISRVSSDVIQKQPVSNALMALQGRMPGVQITQNTGVTGGSFTVRIRGQNSLRFDGNDPFYIIDGVPFISTALISREFGSATVGASPFSLISPSDIESIEVLKDADATAIYGSRGANGVILITTKKGKSGGTRFDIDFSSGISKVANTMDLLNTQQYVEMRKEAFKNDQLTPTPGFDGFDILAWDTTRYTDWQEELIGGTARNTKLQISLNGGNDYTQFLFSSGYYGETTVFPGDFAYKRGTGHLNLNHSSPNKRFFASISVDYQIEDNTPADFTSSALLTPPNAPAPFAENGDLNWGPVFFNNPFAQMLIGYNIKSENFRSNALLDYRIISDLHLKANLGYTKIRTDDYLTAPSTTINPVFGGGFGSSRFGNARTAIWIAEPQVEYSKVIGRNKFNVVTGATLQENFSNSQTIGGDGYTSDLLLDNPQAASSTSVLASSTSEYRYAAIFGRINCNISGKYILNFTARRDGSSRFGSGKQFANFGAVGVAWLFSDEGFIKSNLSFLSLGKLRSSYGTTGSDQIGDYGYLDSYSAASYPYQGVVAFAPTRIANRNYSWEINKKFEVALELGFIEDRFLVTTTYFNNRSSNQLVGLPLSGVTGFLSVQANLPATVENVGWEFEANSINIQTKNFVWSSSLNVTVPKNTLIDYPELENSVYANSYIIGKPITIAKVYEYIGIDPQIGSYQFKDLNEDGIINSPNDNKKIIDRAEKFYGGVRNTIEYKGIAFDFFLQFVDKVGRDYISSFYMPGNANSNQPVKVLERWRAPGDITNVQQFSTRFASSYSNAQRSDLYYTNASFLRLKNVSLTYRLPAKWMHKLNVDNSRIYLQGQNLVTFTSYKGLDPETQSFTQLPPLRTLEIGLQLTLK